MSGDSAIRIPFLARFGVVAVGAMVAIYVCAAFFNKYLLDDLAFVISALIAVWLCGSAWILAGRAAEENGWGDLALGEVIFIPAATFAAMFGSIVLLGVLGFGRMR